METFKYMYVFFSECFHSTYRWWSVFHFNRRFVLLIYIYIICTIYNFTQKDCIYSSLKTTCIFCQFLYIITVNTFSGLRCKIFCKLILLHVFCFKAEQYILCFTKSPTLPPLKPIILVIPNETNDTYEIFFSRKSLIHSLHFGEREFIWTLVRL